MSPVTDGPGEGTWSVFAQKVVAERDALREELEVAHSFHDVACKERDLFKTRLAHAEADAEQAVHTLKAERDALAAKCVKLQEQRDQATTSYQQKRDECDELHAKLMKIRCAHDVCSEVGHPCHACHESYLKMSADLRNERDALLKEKAMLHDALVGISNDIERGYLPAGISVSFLCDAVTVQVRSTLSWLRREAFEAKSQVKAGKP